MTPDHAIDVVESLATHADVSYRAADDTDRFADSIVVDVILRDARNYNAEYAPEYHEPAPTTGRQAFCIYVGDCDDDELIGRVIDCTVDVLTHELREATRIKRGPEWIAPFHPHRDPTIRAWCARTGRPVGADYTYGLV